MVVLATKIYVSGDAKERAVDGLSNIVSNDIGDLNVRWDIGIRHDGFPSVTIEGEDKTAAQNVLRDRFGEITPTFEEGNIYVGTLERWDDDGFHLDAGNEMVIPPENIELGPGSPDQIRTRFGLIQHIPLRFEYTANECKLADIEQDRLFTWTRGNGRVNINSATRAEVRATINKSGHADDIITVERLGLLEQSVICNEDTDPPGLLAAIGDYLPSELLCVIPS